MQIKINNDAVIVMPHIYKKDNDLYKGNKGSGINDPIVKN